MTTQTITLYGTNLDPLRGLAGNLPFPAVDGDLIEWDDLAGAIFVDTTGVAYGTSSATFQWRGFDTSAGTWSEFFTAKLGDPTPGSSALSRMVVRSGLGSWSQLKFVITRGLGAAGVVIVPPPVVSTPVIIGYDPRDHLPRGCLLTSDREVALMSYWYSVNRRTLAAAEIESAIGCKGHDEPKLLRRFGTGSYPVGDLF